MGNIGREQARFEVMPEPEFAVTATGELYEWSPTVPAGRVPSGIARHHDPAPTAPERVDH